MYLSSFIVRALLAFGFAFVVLDSAMASGACSRTIKLAIEYPIKQVNENQNGTALQASRMQYSFFDRVAEKSGCRFEWLVVPRARGLSYFKDGTVDIIYAAQTPERDRLGEFVVFYDFQISLIALKQEMTPNVNLDDLSRSGLLFNFVRGFDYGSSYLELKRQLEQNKRAEDVADVDTIARKMKIGRVHATIMAAPLFSSSAELQGLEDKIVVTPLAKMGRQHAGVYLSKQSVNVQDAALLRNAIQEVASTYKFKEFFEAGYPAWAVKGYVVD